MHHNTDIDDWITGRGNWPGVVFHRSGALHMGIMRAKFARREALRWITHKDYVALLHDVTERSGVPVERTGGGHRAAVTPGPPLTPGHLSRCEWVDFQVGKPITATAFAHHLIPCLPEGLALLWQRRMPPWTPHLMAAVASFCYAIREALDPEKIQAFLEARQWPLVQTRKGRERVLDLKVSVPRLECYGKEVVMLIERLAQGTPKPNEVIASVFGLTGEQIVRLQVERVHVRLVPPAQLGVWKELQS